jgi:small neutral amino acid transporter SnatA (MarC family)
LIRQIALTAFATFFVTVMPLKAAPFFAALTGGWPRPERRRAAVKTIAVSTSVLLVFGLWGDDVLRLFGISLPALRVGGGILLLLASISLISGPTTPGAGTDHHTPGVSVGAAADIPSSPWPPGIAARRRSPRSWC